MPDCASREALQQSLILADLCRGSLDKQILWSDLSLRSSSWIPKTMMLPSHSGWSNKKHIHTSDFRTFSSTTFELRERERGESVTCHALEKWRGRRLEFWIYPHVFRPNKPKYEELSPLQRSGPCLGNKNCLIESSPICVFHNQLCIRQHFAFPKIIKITGNDKLTLAETRCGSTSDQCWRWEDQRHAKR